MIVFYVIMFIMVFLGAVKSLHNISVNRNNILNCFLAVSNVALMIYWAIQIYEYYNTCNLC